MSTISKSTNLNIYEDIESFITNINKLEDELKKPSITADQASKKIPFLEKEKEVFPSRKRAFEFIIKNQTEADPKIPELESKFSSAQETLKKCYNLCQQIILNDIKTNPHAKIHKTTLEQLIKNPLTDPKLKEEARGILSFTARSISSSFVSQEKSAPICEPKPDEKRAKFTENYQQSKELKKTVSLIASYLSPHDLLKLAQLNKNFYALCKDEIFWRETLNKAGLDIAPYKKYTQYFIEQSQIKNIKSNKFSLTEFKYEDPIDGDVIYLYKKENFLVCATVNGYTYWDLINSSRNYRKLSPTISSFTISQNHLFFKNSSENKITIHDMEKNTETSVQCKTDNPSYFLHVENKTLYSLKSNSEIEVWIWDAKTRSAAYPLISSDICSRNTIYSNNQIFISCKSENKKQPILIWDIYARKTVGKIEIPITAADEIEQIEVYENYLYVLIQNNVAEFQFMSELQIWDLNSKKLKKSLNLENGQSHFAFKGNLLFKGRNSPDGIQISIHSLNDESTIGNYLIPSSSVLKKIHAVENFLLVATDTGVFKIDL